MLPKVVAWNLSMAVVVEMPTTLNRKTPARQSVEVRCFFLSILS